MDIYRKLAAEFVGTAALLAVVVGSGIMAERLAAGNAAIALLANSIATGAGLIVLIYGFGHISGAQFNPAVSIVESLSRRQPIGHTLSFIAVQITGAFAGVGVANLMFGLPIWFLSEKARDGNSQLFGEFVATFGLIGVIRLGVRFEPRLIGLLVACYITAAYWFTSSTSFANPAVTVARAATDTFTGISPRNIAGFITAQLCGAIAANYFFDWLIRDKSQND